VKFTLKKPCKNCPFRTDIEFYLGAERAEEIADAVTRLDQTFACHETTVPDDEDDLEMMVTENSQHCAGVLIMLEKMEQPNQMMRISERLGFYDRTKLDMDAPVFDDDEQFIEAYQ